MWPRGDELRAALYGLDAIVRLHLVKEEERYYPLLDWSLDDLAAVRIVAAMHEVERDRYRHADRDRKRAVTPDQPAVSTSRPTLCSRQPPLQTTLGGHEPLDRLHGRAWHPDGRHDLATCRPPAPSDDPGRGGMWWARGPPVHLPIRRVLSPPPSARPRPGPSHLGTFGSSRWKATPLSIRSMQLDRNGLEVLIATSAWPYCKQRP